MHLMIVTHRVAIPLTLTAIVIAGCESQDGRLAEYAQRATEQQARQNERIAEQSQSVARQSQELASAAHKLVEQDATARRELIQSQDKLRLQNQAERLGLDRQREHIEAERKAAAAAAVRDPVIARAIIASGLFLAVLLPLLVTAYPLRRLPEQRPADELLGDALLQSLLTGESIGLTQEGPPQSLTDPSVSLLGAPDDPQHGDDKLEG